MKRIKATFIGKNGSVGLKKNRDYILIVRAKDDVNIKVLDDVNERDVNCLYGSLHAFLSNWDNIQTI
jgi:hypothetical protein